MQIIIYLVIKISTKKKGFNPKDQIPFFKLL